MVDSTKRGPRRKRPKGVLVNGARIVPPTTGKGFPLTAHASGKYCIQRLGRMRFYGRWFARRKGEVVIDPDGWRDAWDAFRKDEPDLSQGREPVLRDPRDDGALTVGGLCNEFHNAKQAAVASGELSPRSFAEYKATTDRIVKHFAPGRNVADLRPDDFAALRASIAQQYGLVRLGNEIGRVRSVFKFAFSNGLIDKPVRFGTLFDKPSKAALRKHRAQQDAKMFEADEIRTIIEATSGPLKAMVLLGINAGFGASDLSALPLKAVNVDTGFIDFPRPKTGIARRIPLWPETLAALRDAIAERPAPRNTGDAALVFLTVRGLSLVRFDDGSKRDEVAVRFGALVRKLKLHRHGRGFYGLRHSFRTVADGARDQVAANAIMGHSDGSMAEHYRHRIEDDRLRAVVEVVRQWLWPAVVG